MRNISLRKFKVEIAEIGEPVEVSRRGPDGDIQLLGFWTPYAKPIVAVHPSTMSAAALDAGALSEEVRPRLEIPVDEEPEMQLTRNSLGNTPGQQAYADQHGIHAYVGDKVDQDGRPKIIKTPEEAARAVRVDPVRAVPKPSARKVKR